jgi:thiol-disulfide isomerase/thioredoxin
MTRFTLSERLSYRSYIVLLVIVFTPLLIGLGWNGFRTVEIVFLVALFIGMLIFWRVRQTKGTPDMDTLSTVQRALRNGERYTLVQLYSPRCAGCVAVKPFVERLEEEDSDRLQVLKLDIEKAPGSELKPEHVSFTPTFLLYDPHGKLVKETYLIVDRNKILYEIDQARRDADR